MCASSLASVHERKPQDLQHISLQIGNICAGLPEREWAYKKAKKSPAATPLPIFMITESFC